MTAALQFGGDTAEDLWRRDCIGFHGSRSYWPIEAGLQKPEVKGQKSEVSKNRKTDF
jgi:hypothetical protein